MDLVECPFCHKQNCLSYNQSMVQRSEGIRIIIIPYIAVTCDECQTQIGLSCEVYDTEDKIEACFAGHEAREPFGTLVQ